MIKAYNFVLNPEKGTFLIVQIKILHTNYIYLNKKDMYRLKLSSAATKEELETVYGRTFQFPSIYKPELVIEGKEESILPIIQSENSQAITFGIWGLLPNDFEGNWEDFQRIFSTLLMDVKKKEYYKLSSVFNKPSRCLIMVTGFFIHRYVKGELYPYYIYQEDNKPFCLGGICTTLNDGFATFSIFTTFSHGKVKEIQNLCSKMPLIIAPEDYEQWLQPDLLISDPEHLFSKKRTFTLKSHPIAKEFFNNNIYYDSILEPVNYKELD